MEDAMSMYVILILILGVWQRFVWTCFGWVPA